MFSHVPVVSWNTVVCHTSYKIRQYVCVCVCVFFWVGGGILLFGKLRKYPILNLNRSGWRPLIALTDRIWVLKEDRRYGCRKFYVADFWLKIITYSMQCKFGLVNHYALLSCLIVVYLISGVACSVTASNTIM